MRDSVTSKNYDNLRCQMAKDFVTFLAAALYMPPEKLLPDTPLKDVAPGELQLAEALMTVEYRFSDCGIDIDLGESIFDTDELILLLNKKTVGDLVGIAERAFDARYQKLQPARPAVGKTGKTRSPKGPK